MHAAAAFAAIDARDAGRCHLHNERRTDAPQTPNARTILLSLIEKSVFRVNSFPEKMVAVTAARESLMPHQRFFLQYLQ